MNTLFKLLFNKNARTLTEKAYRDGITLGFKMGREYAEHQTRLFNDSVGATLEKDVEKILKESGF